MLKIGRPPKIELINSIHSTGGKIILCSPKKTSYKMYLCDVVDCYVGRGVKSHMGFTEKLSLLSLFVSFIALIVSIIAIYKDVLLNRYEFKTIEETKADILGIIATLDFIKDKYQLNKFFQLSDCGERDRLIKFITSDTWVVLRFVLSQKDKEKLMFITVSYMDLLSGDTRLVFRLMSNLVPSLYNYYDEIIAEKKKIRFNFKKYMNYKQLQQKSAKEDVKATRELLFLKEKKKIKDPDIDLWLSVLTNNVKLLNVAIDNGADPLHVTLGDVRARYKDILKEIDETVEESL